MAVNIFATKPLCSTKGVNPWLAKMGYYIMHVEMFAELMSS